MGISTELRTGNAKMGSQGLLRGAECKVGDWEGEHLYLFKQYQEFKVMAE